MVDRQALRRQPAAAVLCEPLAPADPRRCRGARRGLPQGIRRAGADRKRGGARPLVDLSSIFTGTTASAAGFSMTGTPSEHRLGIALIVTAAAPGRPCRCNRK